MPRFDIRIDRIWRGPLLLIGATPRRSFVELTGDAVELSFGGYSERIERSNIKSAALRRWPLWYGLGVRLVPGGAIGLVGSTHGVVQVELHQPMPVRILFGWRKKVRAVAFSLADPDGFLSALGVSVPGAEASPA